MRPTRHETPAVGSPYSSPLGDVSIVLQPIVRVSDGAVVAAEALARFPARPHSPAEETFALAYAAQRGPDLEAACLRAALQRRSDLPANVLLTVNVSPEALRHPAVRDALRGSLSGIVIEITEHVAVDLDGLRACVADFRARGALIAVDDASTGYAGLVRLATLRPDFVKLDRALVTGVSDSVEQSAVIEAIVSLSRRIGATVIGEGVESPDDLISLAALDVDYAQGWAVAQPAPTLAASIPRAVAACRAARIELLRRNIPADRVSGVGYSTAALAGSVEYADLDAALQSAAVGLGIAAIGLSVLVDGERLLEITSTDNQLDSRAYAVADYPATGYALTTGSLVEAHVSDPSTDAAERSWLARSGFASMLLAPVVSASVPLGVLEFCHATHHRWSSHDMTRARIIAEHVAEVLQRLQSAPRN